MSDKINVDDLERKVRGEYNQDGLLELLLGALMFFMAGTFATSSLVVFVTFPIIYINKVLEVLRSRFTYPRIGYAELKPDADPETGYGILKYMLIVVVIMSSALYYLYEGDFTDFSLYKWIPTFIGAMFLGAMLYLNGTTGDPYAKIYAAVSLVGGLAFSFYDFNILKVNIEYYLLSLSAFYLVAGALRLYAFIQTHPVVVVPSEDV